MKSLSIISLLSLSLTLGVPNLVLSHVGHGDEFQATGGIEKVQVNAETDQMLGIVVTPIEQAVANGGGVMIPVTALVDADGKKLVFVQYGNFYEPVEVTTGAMQGELIQVTKELSVGEKLVTQGSLSLYAESRKTKTPDAASSSEPIVSPQTNTSHAQADAQGIPHSHDPSGNMAKQPGETTPQSGGFSLKTLAIFAGGAVVLIGGSVVLAGGVIAVTGGDDKKKISSSKKKGEF
jgi:cation efflux system membrane fusion protein